MRKYLILLIISLSSVLAQNWTIEPIDSSGDMYFDCSIAIDSRDYPHIVYSYRQWLSGNTYLYALAYASWNGIAWEFQPVETLYGSFFHLSGKLSLDNQDHPHIAYCKDSCQVKYAFYDGDSWYISKIDSFECHYMGWHFIDIKLLEDSIPYISYPFINYHDSTLGVRCAHKSADTWIIQTVWEDGRIPNHWLFNTAIDLDRSGYPVIAFANCYLPPIDTGYVFCARFNGQNWNIDTVLYNRVMLYYFYRVYSLNVDGSDRVCIFYQCEFEVFYAMESGDTWNIEFIDINDPHDAAGDMVLDGDKPKVVYSSGFEPLTYAYKVNLVWQYEIIDPGHFGFYTSLAKGNGKDLASSMHVSYVQDNICLCYAQRESPSIAEKGGRSIAESKTRIEIYPNPAKKFLAIRLPLFTDRQTLKIFNASGKLIRKIASASEFASQSIGTRFALRNDGQMKISLKGINPGIYFLQIGTELKKFLIIK